MARSTIIRLKFDGLPGPFKRNLYSIAAVNS